MRFSEIVNEAVVLLRQSRRVTYAALKREFDLDDDALADLTIELIEARRVAIDEGQRVLVWNEAGAVSAQETDTPTALRAAGSPAAERRQLTVMFCDVVGSTSLSGRLDPEQLRDLMMGYQKTCTEVVEQRGGHVAQYLGDGVLVYFGYPVANEDAALNAVRAGLEFVAAMARFNDQAAEPLSVRIGIHTGPVVIGEIGAGAHRENLALGPTPNVAARVQASAQPDAVVVSGATHRLIAGRFECEALGAWEFDGIDEPIEVFRPLAETSLDSAYEHSDQGSATELVGREQEQDLIGRQWREAAGGDGKVVLLSGEPGIGKSRLVDALARTITPGGARFLAFRCAANYQGSALYPVITQLRRLFQLVPEEPGGVQREKVQNVVDGFGFANEDTADLFAHLLGLPLHDEEQLLANGPERIRQRTYDALISWMLEEADRGPIAYVFEDLHWSDPSTLQFLSQLISHVPASSILLMVTFRPEFRVPFDLRSYMLQIALSRLPRDGIRRMCQGIIGSDALPSDLVDLVAQRTDGVPLFVEELTKSIVESGAVTMRAGHFQLADRSAGLTIPATLQDSLMARLDNLPGARQLAQLGSAVGRSFDYEVIRAVADQPQETLQQTLAALVDAELLYRRGVPPRARYTFKHALIQDTAYQSLLMATRRQVHGRIADVLTKDFPAVASGEPETLARHCALAERPAAAIRHWLRAGELAVRRSANVEAIAHLRQGLDLVSRIEEEDKRNEAELSLLARLGPALIAVHGYGAQETVDCFNRGRTLLASVGSTAELFPILYGCWVYHITWAESATADELARQFLHLAENRGDAGAILTGHRILGFTCSRQGRFAEARDELAQTVALYDPRRDAPLAYRYGQDPRATGAAMLAWNLWHTGCPDQAVSTMEQAVAWAEARDHLNTSGYVECFGALNLFYLLRDVERVRYFVGRMLERCEQQGLIFWLGFTRCFEGWLSLQEGSVDKALVAIESGMEISASSNTRMYAEQAHAMHAVALAAAGAIDRAAVEISTALALVERTTEHWLTPELHRLSGEIALMRDAGEPGRKEALGRFTQAFERAQQQGAGSWRLRAATSLARLQRGTDGQAGAFQALQQAYGYFDEGFATPDLVEARALLDELDDCSQEPAGSPAP